VALCTTLLVTEVAGEVAACAAWVALDAMLATAAGALAVGVVVAGVLAVGAAWAGAVVAFAVAWLAGADWPVESAALVAWPWTA
jgi:uncharacterized membrane protein YdjX (TVP38/TMEM64 family)